MGAQEGTGAGLDFVACELPWKPTQPWEQASSGCLSLLQPGFPEGPWSFKRPGIAPGKQTRWGLSLPAQRVLGNEAGSVQEETQLSLWDAGAAPPPLARGKGGSRGSGRSAGRTREECWGCPGRNLSAKQATRTHFHAPVLYKK